VDLTELLSKRCHDGDEQRFVEAAEGAAGDRVTRGLVHSAGS